MKLDPGLYKSYQFFGISLGGGKGAKTSLSLLEYFPSEKKLFLSDLFINIKSSEQFSADSELIDLIESHRRSLKMIGIDVPLSLPPCVQCRLRCPGHEDCDVSEVQWMRHRFMKMGRGRDKKRPNRMFTPYTERCIEQYIQSEIGVDLASDHALGANKGPLALRGRYLKKRLPKALLKEVNTRVSFFRLAKSLGLRKSLQKNYRQLVKGDEARLQFLESLSEKDLCFFYHRDFQAMLKDLNAFESFLSAFLCFLSYKKKCEPLPKGLPLKKDWVLIPKENWLS